MRKKKSVIPRFFTIRFIRIGIISLLAFVVSLSLGLKLFAHPAYPCANSISCIKNLSVDVENGVPGVFAGKVIMPPQIDFSKKIAMAPVLGVTTNIVEKHIYVDLSTQTLYAYDGDTEFMHTLVSTGKWGPTPLGDYKIWIKLPATRMTGGEGDTAYDLPNVPYTMFFYNTDVPKSEGYSLHGAYWHNNFGHPMSHGCVNLRIIDAKKIYDWATPVGDDVHTTYATTENPGTAVSICSSFQITNGKKICQQ